MRTVFDDIIEALPHVEEVSEKTKVCQNNAEILVRTEEMVDAFLDMFLAMGFDPVSGYYDPEEDERTGEVDESTGWWYVSI